MLLWVIRVESQALGLSGSAEPEDLGHLAAVWSCLPTFLFSTPLPTLYLWLWPVPSTGPETQ